MRKQSNVLNAVTTILVSVLAFIHIANGQERKLNMQEAVDLALRQNHAVKIAHYRLEADRQKLRGARSTYYPRVTNESNFLHLSDLQRVEVPAGSLGSIPGGVNLPMSNVFLPQGKETLETSGTEIAQPLTQLIKIHDADKIAAADVRISASSLQATSTEVVFSVHELYYRILTTQLQRKASEAQIKASDEVLAENTEQLKNGSLLQAAMLESRAKALAAKQALLTADMQLSDLTTQLNDVLGLPLDTKLVLDPVIDLGAEVPTREMALQTALKNNPAVQQAITELSKARAAQGAAKAEYLPDITGFARYSYHNGVSFVDHNFGTFGIHLNYDLFDGGKRQSLVRERDEETSEAKENIERAKE